MNLHRVFTTLCVDHHLAPCCSVSPRHSSCLPCPVRSRVSPLCSAQGCCRPSVCRGPLGCMAAARSVLSSSAPRMPHPTHTHTHTHIHTCMNTHICIYTHINTKEQIHTFTGANPHTSRLSHMYSYTHN